MVRRVAQDVWDVDFQVTLPSGRRVRERKRVRGTKRVAQEWERQRYQQLLTTGVSSPDLTTLADFVEEYLDMARVNNKLSAVQTKEAALRNHILPMLGTKPLIDVDERQVERLKAKLQARGLKAKTINNHLSVLRSLLETARRHGVIDRVPDFRWMKVQEADFDFLTFEESEALIAAADPEWRPMIQLALRTGLRLGELLGLQWGDLQGQRLTVRRSYVRGEISTTKTHKSRTIPLASDVVLPSRDRLFVFGNADGTPLEKGCTKWPLWRACDAAGVRRISWHVLRHTFASQLAMRGVSLAVVRELMGHTTIKMTLRYAHLAPGWHEDAVATLVNRWSTAATPERKALRLVK